MTVSQHALQQVSRVEESAPWGGCLVPGGLLLGGVPGPGGRGLLLGGAWSQGGLLQGGCLVETPPGQLLHRAVCILLECILVFM